MCKVECLSLPSQVEELDLPVKRNQAFIIKYFSKTREKFCDHVLGEGKQEKRLELLNGVSDHHHGLNSIVGAVYVTNIII